MKTILVPTNFSDNSRNALNYAIKVAELMDMKIILMNAYIFPIYTTEVPMPVNSYEELKVISEEGLERLRDEFQKKTKTKIKMEFINRSGDCVEEIINAANENNVRLIIMGTKGGSKMRDIFIGNTTASVIGQTSCPVLVIPEKTVFKDIKHILFATNYEEDDYNSINELVDFASLFDSEIIITHIADEESFCEKSMMESFENKIRKQVVYDKISFQLLEGKNISNTLNEMMDVYKIDLLALSTKERKFFEQLFHASLTKKMAYHTKIPLLAFHTKENQ